MIGVALTGEVKVRIFEPYPLDYAAVGCFGLAGYLAALWLIQTVIERREAHRFATGALRMVGIALAILTYFVVPYVPTLIGNLLWCSALFSQIVLGLMRAVRVYKREEAA